MSSINESLFTAQSGDYTPIINTITRDDAIAFALIYNTLESHAQNTKKTQVQIQGGVLITITSENPYTILDYLNNGTAISFEGQITSGNLSIASIATLKAVGVIATADNIHIALTPLGYGFYQSIKV